MRCKAKEIDSPLMTTQEAAAYLKVDFRTIANWRANKKQDIPFVKMGSKVRYRKSDLDAFIESKLVRPEIEP